MRNRRFAGIVALALLAAAGAGTCVRAQSPTSPASALPKAAGPTIESQKAAFLAMPEPDRKAVQDALVWLGLYNGLVDGAFGKRTLDAILAYQAKAKAPADGFVSATQLAALKAVAQKARAGVGFKTLDDGATGIRIGAPMRLLEKRTATTGQTRLTSRDGSISLDLLAPAGPQSSLEDLYLRLTADAPGRKVTYKAIKPGAFFVVSGEESGRRFYQRYEQAADGGGARGLSFAFPAAKAAELDRVALALLNSFQPFPAANPAAPTQAPQTAPVPAPAATPVAPGAPILTATALIVGPGQALTALGEADCPRPVIQDKPAKFIRTDVGTGLALLGGDFAAGAAPIRMSAGGADLVVLSLAPGAEAGKADLQTAEATLAPISGTRNALVASVSRSARGAPVFDHQARLVAIVAPIATEPRRLGAVVLAEPHELIGADALMSFVPLLAAEPASAPPPLRAAEIARDTRGAIVGVYCAP